MSDASADTPPGPVAAPPRRPGLDWTRWAPWRRAGLWSALVLLLLVAQTLLVGLTVNYEASRAQELTDAVAVEAAASVRSELVAVQQQLQSLGPPEADQRGPADWRAAALTLLKNTRALVHVEWRDGEGRVRLGVSTPYRPGLYQVIARADSDIEAGAACTSARRALSPVFSRSYFQPLPGGYGLELMDLCVPMTVAGRMEGFLVASVALAPLLETSLTPAQARSHEITFVEGDGTRLARAGVPRGAGVFRAERLVDLPGATLQLRADNAAGAPRLIPNLSTALVLGLSLALFALVLLLAHDVRRRARAEAALAEALSFRKAMEDSLVTGLRARTLSGRISYVNPAFCAMVGFDAEALYQADEPPYWPPEQREAYRARMTLRQTDKSIDAAAREGFETEFMRRDGERFPVMIYETPLLDPQGAQTGWMSAVLDVSAQRRVEELSRQQQERLQATARLATVGEMASLMSHELNQPLAAISSYASGSLNLLAEPDAETPGLLRQALQRIAEQAERAGRVIKSVHDFVRRREQLHEALGADVLIDSVLPLVRLQARKSGTRIDIQVPQPAPRVQCDRTMVEQVLLNLTRNGIQAMDPSTPAARRVLTLRVAPTPGRWVAFTVQDAGPGVPPEVARQLFTPFFTTRREGMGLGLSLCRTVIEQHGGVLDFEPAPGGGTVFRFTLPVARTAGGRPAAGADADIGTDTDTDADTQPKEVPSA